MANAIDKLTELGGHRYSALPDEQKRALAVAAALEVICAKASGADATKLSVEFGSLSAYADQIQDALKLK
ncbi:hypothetical protein OO258_25735 [Pseudomonas sp. DCB_BI]|uniref:hypothetical protein n=1 Tax=Pseudomonas sp. DCB_BI TaxID=2993594 RepID=UPI00224ACC8A|nr:hypothetical protein [Pseudomonas sp. DCB_BI]MCX2891632.1 hypothetical protein [Pseudomonas sp. DCB_BI]